MEKLKSAQIELNSFIVIVKYETHHHIHHIGIYIKTGLLDSDIDRQIQVCDVWITEKNICKVQNKGYDAVLNCICFDSYL